jgi:hypothetical protein
LLGYRLEYVMLEIRVTHSLTQLVVIWTETVFLTMN